MQMDLLRVGGKRKRWIAEGSCLIYDQERKKERIKELREAMSREVSCYAGLRRCRGQACEHGAEAAGCEER
jgi:hypothetical protein